MFIGAISSVLVIVTEITFNPFGYSPDLKHSNKTSNEKYAYSSSFTHYFYLMVSSTLILRIIRHWWMCKLQSRILKSNDTVIFNPVYTWANTSCLYGMFYWSNLMPGYWLSVVPLASIAFGIGCFFFFIRYTKIGPSRATGFTLTFYSSVEIFCSIFGVVMYMIS